MSQAPDDWIRARLADAPAQLRARMLAAFAGVPGPAPAGTPDPRMLARQLRSAAERLLEQAVTGPASSATAVTLLASDGLATLACEVLAEMEPAALTELE